MNPCPGCGREMFRVDNVSIPESTICYKAGIEDPTNSKNRLVSELHCPVAGCVCSPGGGIPMPGGEANLKCYEGPKGPWGPFSKMLFGSYKSYKIVEESREHVVIDAKQPGKWDYDKLNSIHYRNGDRIVPTALMSRNGWIRWKGVVQLSMGAYPGDTFCGFSVGDKVKLSGGGPEMEIYSFVYCDHLKNDISYTKAWCEWENRKLQGCFPVASLTLCNKN